VTDWRTTEVNWQVTQVRLSYKREILKISGADFYRPDVRPTIQLNQNTWRKSKCISTWYLRFTRQNSNTWCTMQINVYYYLLVRAQCHLKFLSYKFSSFELNKSPCVDFRHLFLKEPLRISGIGFVWAGCSLFYQTFSVKALTLTRTITLSPHSFLIHGWTVPFPMPRLFNASNFCYMRSKLQNSNWATVSV